MNMTRFRELLRRDGWLYAAIALCVVLALSVSAISGSSPDEETRIARVLSEIAGAGSVSVTIYTEDSQPCGAVVVASGAEDIAAPPALAGSRDDASWAGQQPRRRVSAKRRKRPMKLQSLPTFLVRRKNWLLMAALALSLTAALLLRPSSPQAQRVTLPMTSAESSASPLEAFRISRDSAYQRDMAALETLISSENTDRAARQSAAEELQAYVALHQAQLALEGALLTSELAPCCAVVTDGSVTIVTEKQEITEQDTALVLTLVQVHTGVPASGVRIMTAQ